MPSPLFSTFHAGENRVTSSTMSVFERIDLELVRELLEKATETTGDLVGVVFKNQPVTDASVPDARISAQFAWWFETKTERGAYATDGHGRTQLRNHARQLSEDPEARLFVLTPDAAEPRWLTDPDGVESHVTPRIRWISFLGLANAIEDVLGASGRLIGEQTRFLLSELVRFYEAEGLLSNDDTVVVAARIAWGNYKRYSAYICQPDRAFKEGLQHLGFYHSGQIEPWVPRILRWIPDVVASHTTVAELRASGDEIDERTAAALEKAIEDGERVEGERYGVVVLTGLDDPRTIRLKHPIKNDTLSASGRPWAWTLGQRYTSSERLRSGAERTSQLSSGASPASPIGRAQGRSGRANEPAAG